MNGNDLFDALSGLEKTYIDEAAFELHGTPASKQKKAKIASIRKIVFIAIPSAAAILLVVAVAMPFMLSHKSSESASFAPAAPSMDAAAEAPAEEATAEAAEDVIAEAPAADYVSEAEAPAMADEAPAMAESAGAYDAADNAEPAATLNTPGIASDEDRKTAHYKTEQNTATESAAMAESEEESIGPVTLVSARYDKGIITVETKDSLPKSYENMTYSITGTDTTGAEKEYGKGLIKDIVTGTDPLTLDISDLALAKGTYSLEIEGSSVWFVIN